MAGSTAEAPSLTTQAPLTSPTTTATAAARPSPATTTIVTTPPPATVSSPTSGPSADSIAVAVYFIRDGMVATAHRIVPRSQQVAGAAMTELLAGPTAAEAEAGLSTAIPDGVEYLGTAIEGTTATVNLSGTIVSGGGSLSMAARLAQVVYTLTQFPTIEQVTFALDNEPVTVFGGEGLILDHPVGRADFEDLTPLIFVESPAVGDTVTSPVRVHGTANTFEATFILRVLDADGTVLADEVVTATSGTGTRGTFDVTVPFDPPSGSTGTLYVFEASARDGSPVHEVRIPVTFAPD